MHASRAAAPTVGNVSLAAQVVQKFYMLI